MMDMSSSLLQQGFDKEKEFIVDVIKKVGPLSVGGLRAGVVVYNDGARTEIELNDYFDVESFVEAISKLQYEQKSVTRIDLGLKESRKSFSVDSGARGTSKKVSNLLKNT